MFLLTLTHQKKANSRRNQNDPNNRLVERLRERQVTTDERRWNSACYEWIKHLLIK